MAKPLRGALRVNAGAEHVRGVGVPQIVNRIRGKELLTIRRRHSFEMLSGAIGAAVRLRDDEALCVQPNAEREKLVPLGGALYSRATWRDQHKNLRQLADVGSGQRACGCLLDAEAN
jgi:hypothetical protein